MKMWQIINRRVNAPVNESCVVVTSSILVKSSIFSLLRLVLMRVHPRITFDF